MRTKAGAILVTSLLLVVAGFVFSTSAAVVGRLTQVEGGVEFLKDGKMPAVAAKLEDGVEVGDVIRTKSLSKAQVTFVDNTTITLAPESRIAIEEYLFDPAKKQRNAVLQLFWGTAMTAVSKLFSDNGHDFVVRTHTAIMGVRGTEVGIRLGPNDSTFLNFEGWTRVANIFPELSGDLFRKAAKVAYAFPGSGFVDLKDMQGTVVGRGLPPTLPFKITDQDRQTFMRQLKGAFQQSKSTTVDSPFSSGGPNDQTANNFPGVLSTIFSLSPLIQPTITPRISPPVVAAGTPGPTVPTISTFTFTETFSGPLSLASGVPSSTGLYTGLGTRTGIYPGAFTLSFRLAVAGISVNPGTITLNPITGTVTGILGHPFSGTVNITNATTSSGSILNFSGAVTIYPNGNLIASLPGTITAGSKTWYAKSSLSQTVIPGGTVISAAKR